MRRIPMKSGAALWAGAIGVALLAAAGLHWLPHRERPAAAPVPLATPRGITLQLRTVAGRARRAGNPQPVYADAKGMTLYFFEQDVSRGRSACNGECAATWPPAIAPAGAAPGGDWSLAPRTDGTKQWAYHGAPLYRFARDEAIGQANGDGTPGWRVAVFHPEAGMALPDTIEVREIPDAGGAGLVDAEGLTLYTFDGDAARSRPSCPDGSDCARHWAPLEAPQIAHADGDFAVIARDDGITQWAYRHKPLYKFDGDQRAGDANGIGADARFRVALIVRYFMPTGATIRRTVELGTILVANGATLYERDRPASDEIHIFRESHGPPALGRSFGTATCDAECTKSWPPFTAPPDALPSGYWDVAVRADGSRQWVYKGYALYTYALERPGEIRGNGTYDLAQVSDGASAPAENGARREAAPRVAGADPFVPAGGDVAGIGVGAMFWHAVVP